MTLIDTHSHIYLSEFNQDREKILERAQNEGISVVLLPAIDSSTHEQMLELETNSRGIYQSMMGLHPCSVKEDFEEELEKARVYFEKRPFKAVGETGLDFYWDKTFISEQYKAFEEQIRWALEFDIPVVIHSRNSIDECIKMIAQYQKGKLKGVFHCFSGNTEQAKQIVDLGFFLGIGGVITFKNSGLDKVMEGIDLVNVVLETDAPYLAPVPFRGKRNEPSYLKYVVEKIALVKKVTSEEVGQLTTDRAQKLFKL
ncbi:MAG: TatD family hydrolase [Sphingobacteriales bacterium]|nr:TatD family hydrolase [Sphingobacteriales bacterium]